MRYKRVEDAKDIVNESPYFVENPTQYKNKWNDVFQNHHPIVIELGMGQGDFIIGMAKNYPNINFIGIEMFLSQMAHAVQKLEKLHLPNLKLIHMDAKDLDTVFGKEIDTIYLTFCDPWPKKQDEKKRFTHEGFLRVYDKVYKKDKHLILKTDNKGFFQYSLESLSQYWYVFDKISLDLHHEERSIPNIMTDYEKRYYVEGRPIYYVDAKFMN